LSKLRDPDLAYVIAATKSVQANLRPGQLVVLESTTYPGTTRDVVLPILAQTGLKLGEEYFLCFSPERVDPGNETWHTRNTPRLVGGMTPACAEIGGALYGSIVDTIVPVSSVEVAELAKVYENTFRLVNIALANELAHVCSRLNLDVWDVINAASTKPFGFMRFTPGPGLGGHCIPVDPHYLSWKMESLDFKTRLIDLASEINAGMPNFVVELVGDSLNDESRAIRGSNVVVLGVAYKKDIDDYRESPAIDILTLLAAKGANVSFHDPFCPVVSDERLLVNGAQTLESAPLTEDLIRSAHAVVIATDHSTVDYGWVAEHARLVIDTRGVTRDLCGPARIIGLSGKERAPETSPVV
jgi:UDP-N-acetyl-D-glucosamine dehydrogenase